MTRTKVFPISVVGKHVVNVYLLLGRRPVLVDTGMPGKAQLICDEITRHGVDPHDIALIILTHAHVDHFGSAAELRRLTGAPIAGHVDDLPYYRSGRARMPYLPTGPLAWLFSKWKQLYVPAEGIDLDVVITGEMSVTGYGVDARVFPTPGHTAGSACVLTDTGELLAGDLIATSFMGLFPRRPANPPFHDDPLRNIASLQGMLALNPSQVHVGHGSGLDVARVRRWTEKESTRLQKLAAKGRLRKRIEDPALD